MKRPSAREQMILVAERLIAERGIDAVSLREIGAAAGQRNNSAAQYHFGTKEGLVAAIYEYRMRAMNEQRLTALATIEPTGDLAEITELVDLLVTPLIDTIVPGETWYARFLVQLSARGTWAGCYPAPSRSLQDGVWQARGRIKTLLADVPDAVVTARLRLAFGLILEVAEDVERGFLPDSRVAASVAADAIVAMLVGPASARTAAAASAEQHSERVAVG
jgi:AcrR family transcriptional regulator